MIVPTRVRHIAAGLLALALLGPAALAVETVGPGEREGSDEPAPPCPTFHWTAEPAAAGFELTVAETVADGGSAVEYRRLWTVSLPAGSTGWTAAGGRCLERGRTYAWSLRALALEADGDGRLSWSPPRRFRVPEPVGQEELEEALAVVRRHLAERDAAAAAGGASSTVAARVRPGSIDWTPASAPFGTAAIKGTYPGATGETYGVYGRSDSSSGTGVVGYSSHASGVGPGVWGTCEGPSCAGVLGTTESSSGSPTGVYGFTDAADGIGVRGRANGFSGSGTGVYGIAVSSSGTGVRGEASSASGFTKGVEGTSTSNQGFGVWGTASAASGTGMGVRGDAAAPDGRGVFGVNTATSGDALGVYGRSFASPTGRGVWGEAVATTGINFGVYGQSASVEGRAVFGTATATSGFNFGVMGQSASTSGRGVYGLAAAATGDAIGVLGGTNSTSSTAYGVYGIAPGGSAAYAGFFQGGVHVNGNLSKSSGSFKIDHPLDPENRYLYHSFVESPDMMNVYNGNVTLDETGEAWVELPEWFEALNRDFRYQLTPVGDWSACWIAREVERNRFLVRGGPRARVSWQVTGIRKDPWAEQHRIPVEAEKPPEERGRYLHPREWGVAAERGLGWELRDELRRSAEEGAASVVPAAATDGPLPED